jgi:hypothetical protein
VLTSVSKEQSAQCGGKRKIPASTSCARFLFARYAAFQEEEEEEEEERRIKKERSSRRHSGLMQARLLTVPWTSAEEEQAQSWACFFHGTRGHKTSVQQEHTACKRLSGRAA